MTRALTLGVIAGALSADLAAQEPPRRPAWSVTLGAIALAMPRYPGSDEHRVLPLPMALVTFRERAFLGPSTTGAGFAAGAYAIRTPSLGLALELGVLDNRPASRADPLAAMDDRDAVATAGASLSYRRGAFEGVVSVTKGMNDGAGMLGTGRLSISRSIDRRLLATANVGATFCDARHMRRDFGVTSAEATRRHSLIEKGDPRLEPGAENPYRPGGGLRHVGASLSVVYLLSTRWSLVGFGGVDRLGDEAVASSLVRRREQYSGGIGVGYRL